MAIEVITKEDLEQFRVRLLEDIKKLTVHVKPVKKEWLKGSEVRKMLKISSGTLQTLRINQTLHGSKIGGIYYYRLEEIEKLLEK
jgi:hypothetical protein